MSDNFLGLPPNPEWNDETRAVWTAVAGDRWLISVATGTGSPSELAAVLHRETARHVARAAGFGNGGVDLARALVARALDRVNWTVLWLALEDCASPKAAP